MNFLIHAVYVCTIAFIRVYKWIELQVLKVISPIVKTKVQQAFESVGAVIRCAKDRDWTEADNKRVLEKCGKKYNKLVFMEVHNNFSFAKLKNLAMLGLGEAFMDGTLTCEPEDLTEFLTRWMENNMSDKYYYNWWWNKTLEWLELYAFNLQTRKRAFQVGEAHYDLGNELFEVMLDPWMQYTCGYWKDAKNLNNAQINKMELLAQKLDLKPGMRVLDIGCGWGTLCKYLAENYGVECVGVSISEQGVLYGKTICEGLPVDIRLQDYRDVDEKFDRIVCAEMLEHVGPHNYREYFNVVSRCLKDDGIMVLHVIGRNHANFPMGSDPWMQRYIFPNLVLPEPEQIIKATKGLFIIEDWHNFGLDFDKTFTAWRDNFVKGWPKIRDMYDEKFYKMWICYLSSGIALFRSRRCQLWHIVFSKDGLKREYRAAR